MPYSSSYQTDIDLENERHKQAVIHLKRIYRDYQRYLDRSFELLMANLNHKHETEKQNLFTILQEQNKRLQEQNKRLTCQYDTLRKHQQQQQLRIQNIAHNAQCFFQELQDININTKNDHSTISGSEIQVLGDIQPSVSYRQSTESRQNNEQQNAHDILQVQEPNNHKCQEPQESILPNNTTNDDSNLSASDLVGLVQATQPRIQLQPEIHPNTDHDTSNSPPHHNTHDILQEVQEPMLRISTTNNHSLSDPEMSSISCTDSTDVAQTVRHQTLPNNHHTSDEEELEDGKDNQSSVRETSFVCQYCQRGFKHKGARTSHLRTHTGERPYACSYCDQSFKQGGDCTRHERTAHSGAKPYHCRYCKQQFARKDYLNNHKRSQKHRKNKRNWKEP
eukprot:202877_1